MKDILIEDFNYELPAEKIAFHPLDERNRSRLLVYEKGAIKDASFSDIAQYIPVDATMIVNNTRVIEARILFQKSTGGVIEIFCLEPFVPSDVALSMSSKTAVQWHCLIGGASKWKPGQVLEKLLHINGQEVKLNAHYISKEQDDFIIEFSWEANVAFSEIIHAAGAIPLPPYIKREATKEDESRYQTVFAQHAGSVAAPTAALHFTDAELEKLKQREVIVAPVTLHVGAGTFKPVKTGSIEEHVMHAEHFEVSIHTLHLLAKANYIVAVGTTSLRTLESLYWLAIKISNNDTSMSLGQWEAYELSSSLSYAEAMHVLIDHANKENTTDLQCQTSLLIRPGYTFQSAKALITNFHQPRSTLLLLVAAFIGDDWKKVYDHALKNNYRFLSYGDSSLLFRND